MACTRSNGVEAGRKLLEIAPLLTRFENVVLAEAATGMTFRQFRLLSKIEEGKSTLTQIGRVTTISLPAISESIEGLVVKGLVSRTADSNDRRAVILALTKAGEGAMASARKRLDAAAAELLQGVPLAQRARLAKQVEEMYEFLDDTLRRKRDAQR